MHWSASPGAGFTTGEPWLPLAADFATRNVEAQRADPASILCLYRDLLALRRATPTLERGAWRALDAPDGVLAYERRDGASRALVALNFTAEPRARWPAAARVRGGLSTLFGVDLPEDAAKLQLAPSSGAVLVVDA
jgi:glycosidase